MEYTKGTNIKLNNKIKHLKIIRILIISIEI